MALTRYEPSFLNYIRDHLNQLQENDVFPSLFGEESNVVTSDWRPSVDIREEKDNYVFLADIPGVDPDEIEVNTENDTLTIKGERKQESKEEKEGYKRVERVSGSFYRRFALPADADAEKIKAKSKHGVLEIKIPKSSKSKAHKIPVSKS